MNTRTFALALALSAAALPALAQQGDGGHHGQQGRGQMAGRMHRQGRGGGGIQALIARREQLGLSADQVARLQALQQRQETQGRALRDQLRALRPDSAHRGTLTADQRKAIRDGAQPIRQQLQAQRKAMREQVAAILTPAQRQQVAAAVQGRARAFRAGARQQRGGGLQRLLVNQQTLGLSADQVSRLTAIQTQLTQKNASIVAQLQRLRPDSAARAGVRGGQLSDAQKQALQARREQVRPLMQQIRENQRAAMEQARSVLTADQQQRVRQQLRQGRGQRGEGRGARGGRRGNGGQRPAGA